MAKHQKYNDTIEKHLQQQIKIRNDIIAINEKKYEEPEGSKYDEVICNLEDWKKIIKDDKKENK